MNLRIDHASGRLYEGDCLDILTLIPDASVDMVLCDLPYGTTSCRWDTPIDLTRLWDHYHRITKRSAAIVLTASQPFTTRLISSNMQEFRYSWVWVKDKPSNFALANRQPMKYHEDVCVFYRAQPTYNKQMQPREGSGPARYAHVVDNSRRSSEHINLTDTPKFYDPQSKNPSSVQYFSTGVRQKLVHSAQKPQKLFEYLIRTYTDPGDVVLDNCIGSGTTALAAIELGRRWIGVEIDKTICDLAESRIRNKLQQDGK